MILSPYLSNSFSPQPGNLIKVSLESGKYVAIDTLVLFCNIERC